VLVEVALVRLVAERPAEVGCLTQLPAAQSLAALADQETRFHLQVAQPTQGTQETRSKVAAIQALVAAVL
jgi:transcription termination factor Rho